LQKKIKIKVTKIKGKNFSPFFDKDSKSMF